MRVLIAVFQLFVCLVYLIHILIALNLRHKGNVFILNTKTFCVKFTQDRRFSIEITTIQCLFSIFSLISHAYIDYCIRIFLRQIIVIQILLGHQIYFAWDVSDIKPRDSVLTAQNVYFSVIILPCAIYLSSHDTLSHQLVVSDCLNPCIFICQLHPIVSRVVYRGYTVTPFRCILFLLVAAPTTY